MFLNLIRYGVLRARMQWALGLSLLLLVALFARPVAAQTASAAPAKGARTILVMGDSLSAAYGLAPAQGWVALTGDRIGPYRLTRLVGRGQQPVVEAEVASLNVKPMDAAVAERTLQIPRVLAPGDYTLQVELPAWSFEGRQTGGGTLSTGVKIGA